MNTYGEKSPTKYQINRMLTSEIYAGMRYGRDGFCEPYITKEQHNMILKICNAKTYPATNEPYLFSNLIKCPYCGTTFTGFKKRHTCRDGSVREYKRYRRSNKFSEDPSTICITEHVIEDYLLENLYPTLTHCLYELNNKEQNTPARHDNTPKIMEEMERLNILFQKGRITLQYYDEQYDKLEKSLARNKEEKTITIESYRHIEKTLTGNWKDFYDQLDYAHRKTFGRAS